MYNTIVIGLGAAGVTAASTLARAGRRVLGVEAMDRIGGRVMTVPFGEGVVELGAEWIHGTKNNRAYELANQNKIPLVEQDLVFGVYQSNGLEGDAALINELTGFCLSLGDSSQLDKPGPLGEYITKRLTEYLRENYPKILLDTDFIAEFLYTTNLLFNNYNGSNNWNDISTHSKYQQLEGHPNVSLQKYGYRTFFEILLNTYNEGPGLSNLDIELKKEVTLIKWPKEAGIVEVICKDGEKFIAENVIVTVSLGVLKERHNALFSPQLPTKKIEAIKNLTVGIVNKIVFKFKKPWWPNTVAFNLFLWKGEDKRQISPDDYWTTRIFACTTPAGSKNVLTLWTNGDIGKMVETLPESLIMEKCLGLLRKFMGKSFDIPEPTGIIRSTWHSNPYTRGSYTYDHINAHLYPEAREHLAEPLLDQFGTVRVLFAGEATNLSHFSTVHGASDSGQTAATKLLSECIPSKL